MRKINILGKRIAIFVGILIFFLGNVGDLFAINFPEDFVLNNLPDYIKELKKSSVLILVGQQKDVVGTGFLTLNKNHEIVVITNKHVALLGPPLFVRVNGPTGTIDCFAKLYKTAKNYDLALINLKSTFDNPTLDTVDQCIPESMFAGKNDIMEGKEVVYIGYPLRLGVEERNYPVSRQALIAQVIPKKHTYLLDGTASHGNSGSPVFDRKTGKLIGMVESFNADFIDLFTEQRVLTARLPYNSGISKVVSSEVIKKFVYDF